MLKPLTWSLAEAGYEYVLDWCADDDLFMNTRRGKILSVPYPLEAMMLTQLLSEDPLRRITNLCFHGLNEMMRQAENGQLFHQQHPHIIARLPIAKIRNVLARLSELRKVVVNVKGCFCRL